MFKQKSGHEPSQTTEDDDDNPDLETLQARIDMSMSYAQDLVSSWIEPNKVATSSRSHNLEEELKEYLKRPPRLGVGASVPAENNLSKEAARLKGQLLAKIKPKRPLDGVDKRESDSDDVKDSKAGIVRKKTKIDPFAPVFQLNKKSKSHLPSRAILESHETTKPSLNCSGVVTEKPTPVNLVKPAYFHASPLQDARTSGASSVDSTAAKISKPEALDPVTQADTAQDRFMGDKTIKTPSKSPSKVAVLNLDGPPPSDDDRIATQAHGQSRKKKRKRRKNKKHFESKG